MASPVGPYDAGSGDRDPTQHRNLAQLRREFDARRGDLVANAGTSSRRRSRSFSGCRAGS